MNRYSLNANPTVSADFTDEDGVAADPTTVTLVVTKPDATTATYTNVTLDNPAVGTWSKTLVVNQAGTWSYTFTGTGAVAAASSGSFEVGPGIDIITLSEAKRALNIPDATTTHDTELASYITTVSQRLDALVGPIVKRTVTAEAADGRCGPVRLRFYPVASVTTVVERQGAVAVTLTAENFAAVTTNDYDIDLVNGLLHRRSGGYYARWYPGRRNIIVTYVAGRFDSTATVEERYKQAAAIFLTHLWRKEQGASGQTFGDAPPDTGMRVPSYGVPNAVRDLLSDQLLEPAVA